MIFIITMIKYIDEVFRRQGGKKEREPLVHPTLTNLTLVIQIFGQERVVVEI